MTGQTVTTEAERAALQKVIARLKLPVTVTWQTGRRRSLDQNALQWLWASEVARYYADRTASRVQAEWKLRHGVPILREDSPEFRRVYDKHLKPLSYEEKVDAMEHMDIGVTRALKVPQMRRYLDAIQQECAEFGVKLTDPEELRYASQ